MNAIWKASVNAGILTGMAHLKKVTVVLPEQLLAKAQKSTREGVTATIRHGLELVAASAAYERVRAMRGKVRFSIDLDEMREDRS